MCLFFCVLFAELFKGSESKERCLSAAYDFAKTYQSK